MQKLNKILGIILAGGRGSRMGGVDKGLVLFNQQPLIQHVIHHLTPQVHTLIINANREISQYQTFGFKVMQDDIADFAGPLAGIRLGLLAAQQLDLLAAQQNDQLDFVLSAPCDSPNLPSDLAQRLMQGLIQSNADIAVASSEGNSHPVFCLCKKTVLASLDVFLAQGGRKVSAWQKSQAYTEVDFTDCSAAFVNINTAQDLADLESKVGGAMLSAQCSEWLRGHKPANSIGV